MSSKRADSTKDMTFASFFHNSTDSDLIDQVEWIEEKLHLSDTFFSGMLGIDVTAFSDWRLGHGSISEEKQNRLKEFWRAVNHILSFLNYDLDRVRTMFDYKENRQGINKLPFTPPWVGTSLRSYLQTHGAEGIEKVNEWMQSVRFASSY